MAPNKSASPALPPEASLIRQLRERPAALSRKMSLSNAMKRLAEIAPDGYGFSDGTWRNIEAGRKIAEDWELVLIGLVLYATPEQVAATGRATAAELLRKEIDARAKTELAASKVSLDDIPAGTKQKLLRQLAEIDNVPGATEKDRQELREVLFGQIDALMDMHAATLRLRAR
ncbi:hypothetical protein [Nonomuraea longicatena]|uniref:Uncharacterized protein n=1 Tax=Nonomuraea longicatena TaxID=83682 RepID=A0ABP3ZCW8_9ACTN